jgi:lysophospholipase L1-like esterase
MARRQHPALEGLLRISLLALMAAALLMTTSYTAAAPPQPKPYLVYFLGDSLTAGRAATSVENTFRRLLLAHLRQNPRYAVSETGLWRGGWRVADALAAAVDAPPRANTALIVIELGTNDASGNFGANRVTDPTDFATDYAQLVAYLQAEAPDAKIACLSTWWSADLSAAYNRTIQHFCPPGGHVDITTLYGNESYHGPAGLDESWYRPGWTTDTYHPNDAGMRAIARKIETSL